jgi:hypothetical protein
MGAVCSSVTTVLIYKFTRRYSPVDKHRCKLNGVKIEMRDFGKYRLERDILGSHGGEYEG